MLVASLLLSAWLALSAFVIPQPYPSAVVAFCAGVVTFVAAVVAGDRWVARFLWTGGALAIAGAVVFARSVPDAVALNHAVVAPLLLVLALVKPGALRHLRHA